MAHSSLKLWPKLPKRANAVSAENHSERVTRAFSAYAARPNKQSDLPFVNRHQERAYGKRLRNEATKLRLEYQANLK